MKLQNNKRKKIITITIIAVLAVLLIAGIVFGIVFLSNPDFSDIINGVIEDSKKKDDEITEIMMSVWPKTEYYIGDEFDPSGTSVQVVAVSDAYSYFVDHTQLRFSGFDSSVANDALVITVTYKEFTTTFNVKITERPAPPAQKTLESIEVSDNFVSTFTKDNWSKTGPDFNGRNNEATLVVKFSDGSETQLSGLKKYCAIDLSWGVGEHDLVFSVTYEGKTVTCTVPITITN